MSIEKIAQEVAAVLKSLDNEAERELNQRLRDSEASACLNTPAERARRGVVSAELEKELDAYANTHRAYSNPLASFSSRANITPGDVNGRPLSSGAPSYAAQAHTESNIELLRDMFKGQDIEVRSMPPTRQLRLQD